MDYTPISTRRVLLAFSFTMFVALLPVFYLVLKSGSDGSLSVVANADDPSRDMLLIVGSVVLTAALIGVFVMMMLIGRRVVRGQARA